MTSFYEDREIWFVTGSRDLYGEEALAQVAQQSQEVVRLFNESDLLPVPIVWEPVLKDFDAIKRAMLKASADDRVLGVISWMHILSPAKTWIRSLEVLREPLSHLTTQANVEVPWDSIDMDFMNLNQAAHDNREYAYILTRLGLARATVIGHASQDSTRRRVANWVCSAGGFAATSELRVVRFGDNIRNVAVTEGDKTEAERRLGVSVNTRSVNDLVAVVDAADEEAIDALVAEYCKGYDVVPELALGDDCTESLRYVAREEIVLRTLPEEHGTMAFTTNFEDLDGLRQLPGLAVQRLTEAGCGFNAEGNWKTVVLVRATKVMGEGLPGGASLMEDYTCNLVEGQEMILGAHMFEMCPSLTNARPRIEIHPLGVGDCKDPVRMVFDAAPGRGVVVAMSDMCNRFRLTANIVNVIKPPQPMSKLPVARATWIPEPDFYTPVEAWLTAGEAHHTCMSMQIEPEMWENFAALAHMELVVIDELTTRRDFASGVRWNQVCHRLAEGL